MRAACGPASGLEGVGGRALLHGVSRGPKGDVKGVIDTQYGILEGLIALEAAHAQALNCPSASNLNGLPCVRKPSWAFSDPKYSAISFAMMVRLAND